MSEKLQLFVKAAVEVNFDCVLFIVISERSHIESSVIIIIRNSVSPVTILQLFRAIFRKVGGEDIDKVVGGNIYSVYCFYRNRVRSICGNNITAGSVVNPVDISKNMILTRFKRFTFNKKFVIIISVLVDKSVLAIGEFG